VSAPDAAPLLRPELRRERPGERQIQVAAVRQIPDALRTLGARLERPRRPDRRTRRALSAWGVWDGGLPGTVPERPWVRWKDGAYSFPARLPVDFDRKSACRAEFLHPAPGFPLPGQTQPVPQSGLCIPDAARSGA